MVKKQNIWFITLFSLILVLSVWYIGYPSSPELNGKPNTGNNNNEQTTGEVVESTNPIVKLRLEQSTQLENRIDELNKIISDANATKEAKSKAQDEITSLNKIAGIEDSLEKLLKQTMEKDCFVGIDGSTVKVVVAANEHSTKLANDIMNDVQSEFDSQMVINVTFEATN